MMEVEGRIVSRKSWYLLPVLLLCIGSSTHAYAQGGCSIVNLRVNYPSPAYVGQPFMVTVDVTVWCTFRSYIRSDISASLGSLSAESTLTDKNATFAQSGSYQHQLTLTAVGNWSLDGEMLIIDSYYNNPIASSNYHYNINVLPAGSVNTQTLSTSETTNESTTTITQISNSTITQTTSWTITVETPTPTTVTSIITTTNELIPSDATYSSLVIVLAVLFLAALIGLIVRRRTQ